ncbi:MAG: hypothetical protein HPZ91_08405 [Lentisphaeria bacterium]|nr:hypothetical protein [Lentisphaeria bacterium]
MDRDFTPELLEQSIVGSAWSGHKVNFCLFTTREKQYVGYYGADRRLVIAARVPGSGNWERRELDTAVVWDSHNSIEMFCSGDGILHIAANMHVTPLIYYRMERPHDLASITRRPAMVGRDEERCTYPRFMKDAAGELIFHYRDGCSGSGNEIYNRYDAAARRWTRLLDRPLTFGGSEMNAYFFGPVMGPDGFFHLGWVWRDTGDCVTNHDLSYARSRDLVHWETAAGVPAGLPMTLGTPGLVVVPTARTHSGLINMGSRIGFDGDGKPVLSFHIYGPDGASRLCNARPRADGSWQKELLGEWPKERRWEFSGHGSIGQMLFFTPVEPQPDGTLLQSWEFIGRDSGTWRLDPVTLKMTGTLPPRPACPPRLQELEQNFPGLQVRWQEDAGEPDGDGGRSFLRWETLPANRDMPREGALPAPTRVSVCRVRLPEVTSS